LPEATAYLLQEIARANEAAVAALKSSAAPLLVLREDQIRDAIQLLAERRASDRQN
jgi:hypothetical protein